MSDTQYIGLREAAERLGVRPYQITYAHAAGFVGEPPRFLGKRAYDATTLQELRNYFAARAECRLRWRPRQTTDPERT